jgi:hypothetical protein
MFLFLALPTTHGGTSLAVDGESSGLLSTEASLVVGSPDLINTSNSFAALDPEVPAPSSLGAYTSILDPEIPAPWSPVLSPLPVASTVNDTSLVMGGLNRVPRVPSIRDTASH